MSQIEKIVFSQEKTLIEHLEKELEAIKISRNKVIKTIYEVE